MWLITYALSLFPAHAWRYYTIGLATRFPDHYICPRFCSGFSPVVEAIAFTLLEGFLNALVLIGGDVGPPSSAGFIKDVRGYIRNRCSEYIYVARLTNEMLRLMDARLTIIYIARLTMNVKANGCQINDCMLRLVINDTLHLESSFHIF